MKASDFKTRPQLIGGHIFPSLNPGLLGEFAPAYSYATGEDMSIENLDAQATLESDKFSVLSQWSTYL